MTSFLGQVKANFSYEALKGHYNALRKYLTYNPVSPKTPVNSYTINGRKYTNLSEESKIDARNTETIYRQRDCYKRYSFVSWTSVGIATTAYKVTQFVDSLWSMGLSGMNNLYYSVAMAVVLPFAAHKITKRVIEEWGKRKEEPISYRMQERIQNGKI